MTEFENVLALELGDEARLRPRPGRGARWRGGGEPRGGRLRAVRRPRRPPPAPAPGVEVRVCTGAERGLWGQVAARAFNDECEPEPAHEEFGALMAARDDAVLVLGWVDGQPAGTGALVIDGGVGWLSGDSTLPQYRRRGVQQAVQRHRLQLAREAGCALAVTEASPGSGSQRNMERLGFRVVYTHLEFARV